MLKDRFPASNANTSDEETKLSRLVLVQSRFKGQEILNPYKEDAPYRTTLRKELYHDTQQWIAEAEQYQPLSL